MTCGSGKNVSIQSSLFCVAIPLTVGVTAALIATIAFLAATTPQWMTGVTSALEIEEKLSLGRLSVAQAQYSEAIMGQMVSETDMMAEYALQIFMTDSYTGTSADAVTKLAPTYNMTRTDILSDPSLPAGAWMWGYPFSSTSGVLEVGAKPPGKSPGDIVRANSLCTTTFTTNCWTEPVGGVRDDLRDGTKGNLKTSVVFWPPQLGVKVNELSKDLLEEIRLTSFLEGVMSEVYFANPTAINVYLGTERSGIMRQYPYTKAYTISLYEGQKASATPPFSTDNGEAYYGYDPRNRPWYAEAKYKKKLIVSAPYVYSTPPFPIGITVAKPIFHPITGELFGVVGFDVTVSLLEKVVLSSSILYNGYAYLVNTEGRTVVYPCSKLGGESKETCESHRCTWSEEKVSDGQSQCTTPGSFTIQELEFESDDITNRNSFNTNLWEKEMKVLKSGGSTFYKTVNGNKQLWHIAYSGIPVSSYSLALVVPDADIQLPATTVSNSITSGIAAQVTTYVVVTGIGLLIFYVVLHRVSYSVVRPVKALKEVIDQIIQDLNRQKDETGTGGPGFQLDINESIRPEDEMCKEVSMMKESFEYMVRALKFGKNAFKKNDLKAAKKVYQDALTMYQNLKNDKGIGIANFNLGATEHRKWLMSDKVDQNSYGAAENYYRLAINMARKQWGDLNRADSSDQHNSRNSRNSRNNHDVVVNIEMTNQKGRRSSGGPGQSGMAPTALKGVNLGVVGHDIADRLSGRLYQLAQLFCDIGNVDAAVAAEPLLREALEWDVKTNNLLGYAKRVGLLCKILVVLNRYQEANEKIEEQLAILRRRLMEQEDSDDSEYGHKTAGGKTAGGKMAGGKMAGGGKQNQRKGEGKFQRPPKRSRSEQERDQERDELFQALQHCLKDAAVVQGCSLGDDHLALRYFIEALSCAPRSEPYVLNSIFRELGEIVDRNGWVPTSVRTMIDAEVKKHGVSNTPKDVAFVIDYSGSMSGGKMRKARKNTKTLIEEQLSAEDRASIIQFNSSVTMLTPTMLYKTDGDSRGTHLERTIDGMQKPNSGTALWDAIGAAINQLDRSSMNVEREKWIIVLTDGEDNRSRSETPESLRNRFAQSGGHHVIILAVGVSEVSAQRSMQTVVTGNDYNDGMIGELIAIDNSSALEEAFATIASIIGDHVRVEQH